MKALLVVLTLLVAGCTPATVYITTPLPVPVEPTLPMVMGHELECLSESAYERMLVRETRLRNYAERLRAIIEEHNRDAEQQ